LLAALAEKILGFGADALTPAALGRARTSIIDTVAVTLAGIPEPCTQIALKTNGIGTAPGPCLVFGTDRRTSALEATFINGVASHALDYDDFSGVFGGHQSVPLVPALLALAEERGLSGHAVLVAYVAGVEVETRLARAVHFHHYDKGWHPTATLGTIGAAAACGHLIGLDHDRLTMALAIAPSLSSGLKANFGTMTKPLHIGQCGRNGLMAALLAEQGFDANPGVLEHHQGFFTVFNGPGTYATERLLEDWRQPLEVTDPTFSLKQFPCCGSTHSAIQLMLSLVQEEALAADDVAAIEILPHGRRLRHTDTPSPKTALQAKFSIQYVVARALLDGAVRLKDFEPARVAEPGVQRLLAMTKARPHPDWTDDGPEQWGAELMVTLKNGRTLTRRAERFIGWGSDGPVDRDALWTKFEDCGTRCLPPDRLAAAFEALVAFETIADLEALTRLLEG
jgi:2-methylcitrate dehydratase PrpD